MQKKVLVHLSDAFYGHLFLFLYKHFWLNLDGNN